MSTPTPRLFPFFVALALCDCAAAPSATCPTLAAPPSRRISGAELMKTARADLYQALQVRHLRFFGSWAAKDHAPVVYVDGARTSGGLDVLGAIPVSDVAEVLFLAGPEATPRYGTGHVGGAVAVWTHEGQAAGRCGA
ncbi:MAG: hypothetical protein FIA95_05825 [Gemmatimonadetes bacterium]|nr:hypothetical protein [Gemmatimonadota bacterium]